MTQTRARTVFLLAHTGRPAAIRSAELVVQGLLRSGIGVRVLAAEAADLPLPDEVELVQEATPQCLDGCELLIVLGTSSSESVLPRMMAKMENLGAKKSVVGLVIPTGYSFNLDGTSIYLTMAAVFIAQATNTQMTIGQQITLLAVLLLTSKGAAGVTGSGFIVLAATLSSVEHIPVAAIALILGVDRFMSEARALTNLIGNGVATVVVARWEGELDTARMHAELNGHGSVAEPGAHAASV